MPEENRDSLLSRTTRAFQENAERSGPAAGASYTLIGAILLLGGIGYALDSWQGGSHGFLLTGLVLGIIVGFVDLARVVWKK